MRGVKRTSRTGRKAIVSRRFVLLAAVLFVVGGLLGLVLLVSVTSEGPGAPVPPGARVRSVAASGDPTATARAKSPEPGPPASAATVAPSRRNLAFHGVKGVVLLDGERTAAQVELRCIRPGDVGYVDDGCGPCEISLVRPEWDYPHWRYDNEAIPDLVRRRDPFDEPEAVASAGADGRFRVGRLAPGLWEVLARAADGRSVAVTVEVKPREPVGFVELHLPAGRHTFAGSIRFADGGPFTGVVRLVEDRTDTGNGHRATVLCDAHGGFRFAHVASGTVWVLAWMPGAACIYSEEFRIPCPEPLEIVLDPAPRRIVGRVIDHVTGESVAGARVTVERGGRHVESATVTATSEADGRFAIACGPDTKSLSVEANSYVPRDFLAGDMGAEPCTIRLRRLGGISGRGYRSARSAASRGRRHCLDLLRFPSWVRHGGPRPHRQRRMLSDRRPAARRVHGDGVESGLGLTRAGGPVGGAIQPVRGAG